MEKKVLFMLLVIILVVPNVVLAESEYVCTSGIGEFIDDENNTYHFRKSDPKMDIIKNEYNKTGFYDEDNYGKNQAAHKVDKGSNPDICKVFCREDVDYYFYGIEEVMAGRYFQYDVKAKGLMTVESLLTAQIRGTKECTSVVNYKNWMKNYYDAHLKTITAWDELKYWESFFLSNPDENSNVSNVINPESRTDTEYGYCSSSTNCKRDPAFIPSLTYTYYVWPSHGYYGFKFSGSETNVDNHQAIRTPKSTAEIKIEPGFVCNGGADNRCPCIACTPAFDENGPLTQEDIDEKKLEIIGNYEAARATYMNALNARENIIMMAYNCNLYSSVTENKDYRTTSNLGFGSEKSTYPIEVKTSLLRNTIKDGYASVFGRCKEDDGLCNINYGSSQTGEHDKEYGDTPKLGVGDIKTSTKSTSYCSVLDYSKVQGPCLQKAITSGNTTDANVSYINCYGGFDSAYCNSSSIKLEIPINSMATFSTSLSYEMWQKETYTIDVYTGISHTSENVSTASSTIQLDEKSYPVSLYTPKGKYKVAMDYFKGFDKYINRPSMKDIKDLINTFDVPKENALEFLSSNRNASTSTYSCYILVDNETTMQDCENNCCHNNTCKDPDNCDGPCNEEHLTLGFIYRTIDLENIFPSGMEGRGRNWKSDLGQRIKSLIENKGDNIWNNSNNYLEYSFTLTPQNRKNIIEYNHLEERNFGFSDITYAGAGYLNNTITGCSISSEKEFSGCKSSFLTNGEGSGYFTGGKVSQGGRL